MGTLFEGLGDTVGTGVFSVISPVMACGVRVETEIPPISPAPQPGSGAYVRRSLFLTYVRMGMCFEKLFG